MNKLNKFPNALTCINPTGEACKLVARSTVGCEFLPALTRGGNFLTHHLGSSENSGKGRSWVRLTNCF